MRTGTTRGALAVILALVATAAGCKKDECGSNEACDDGLYCNGQERCVNGACVGGMMPSCDDGIDSTEDRCDEDSDGCVHDCIDVDGDGYLSVDCDGGDDCDDSDAGIHPGATEVCNGVDDDCDHVVWEDADGDRHLSEDLCVDVGGDDCDDSDPEVYAGAPEICDGKDNNCVMGADDEPDTDGDGHVEVDCSSNPGGDDCDDEDPDVHPGASEVCNGTDDDCSGTCDDGFDCCAGVDEMTCTTVCFSIGRGPCTDGCESPDGLTSCTPPEEVCNGVDDDCDTVADDGFDCMAGASTECTTRCDTEGRGTCTAACEAPLGDDCFPPTEQCNGIDDDCDGACDESFACCAGEDVTCTTTCGSTNVLPCREDCTIPDAGDCTLAAELDCFDGQDDDCDGYIDEYGDTDCL